MSTSTSTSGAKSTTRTERRSHTCNQLRASDVGQTVKLGGWVYRKRDQKHQVFIDLRDHYGVTQLVFDADRPEQLEAARAVRPESVVFVSGEVVAREAKNPKMATGEVELKVTAIEVDSPCEDLSKLLPVAIPKGSNDRDNEQRRMEYRFLDLRRERMHRNIVARDQIIRFLQGRNSDTKAGKFGLDGRFAERGRIKLFRL